MKAIAVLGLLVALAFASTNAEARGKGGGGKAGKSPRPSTSAPAKSAPAKSTPVHVKQYVRPTTGTVVKAHDRTPANKTQMDNWSSKPNTNPTTGKPGTRAPTK